MITFGITGKPYILFIDPLPWNFEIKPSSIAIAIQWANRNGWSAENGPTKGMALNDETGTFRWLPDGKKHLHGTDKKTE